MSAVLGRILPDIAFWTCLASVLMFAYSRFNVSLPNSEELSPPLLPRSFTTSFRYELAAFTYVGFYVFVYLLLLFAGSMPALQETLIKLFGGLAAPASLGGTGVAPEPIGTPAWAAIVATAALPAVPGFSWLDERLRNFFNDFASIPGKAKLTAQEILTALPVREPSERVATAEAAAAALNAHKQRFAALRSLIDQLKTLDDVLVLRHYLKFFGENQGIIERIENELAVNPSQLTTVDSALYAERRFRSAVRRMGLFVACAMLSAERSEYQIRLRLKRLGFSVRLLGLDFGPNQLLIAVTTIAVATIVGCYLSVIIQSLVQDQPVLESLGKYADRFFLWAVVTDLTYMPPLLLSAGIAMYLLDREAVGHRIEVTDTVAAAIVTFVGAAGLAFIILLANAFLQIQLGNAPPVIHVVRILPWSLPSATVATVFMLMSQRPRLPTRLLDSLIDGGVHGSAAAIASELALSYLGLVNERGQLDAAFPGLFDYLAPISGFCVGASIGAVLCATCRHRTARMPGPRRALETRPPLRRKTFDAGD